ncbi:MAG: flavin reductase [Saprospirales bacterium]|nr:flavin reductase [Saprospirales bacterium]MBK8922630.1 flavin reductase [Saprospirales bacterium]
MLTIDPTQIPTKDLHQYMLGAVAPRPIAFASTISPEGVPNLAPYSFFNAFSSNPPILIFSSNRRVANNTTKDTLRNVEETREVVINVVSHSIVRQMALCSIEYDATVNEFEKAGLTPLASELVRPFRVAESPVQMECIVEQILPLGDRGGAGNLIICRIVRLHIDERVLTDAGRIDPHKIDLVGRMGRFYYARASGAAVLEVVQPVAEIGVGFDALPRSLRLSTVLTGNDLARIAALPALPDAESIAADPRISNALAAGAAKEELHALAKEALQAGDIELGAKLALAGEIVQDWTGLDWTGLP